MAHDTQHEAHYAALLSKDARFDGRFFVGISSTGIYCRPVCRARTPKQENCTFFDTAAEAESKGYRPCLKCRPELAPGRSLTDAHLDLANRAARLLEEDCRTNQSLVKLSERLGYTDRHVRRVFSDTFHVSPLQYLQTCRLLLAKSLLTDTELSISDVAMASGFGSVRRFNDSFKKHYQLSPTKIRKSALSKAEKDGSLTLQLGYRPPYLWDEMLEFLSFRAIPGVERVTTTHYLRTVRHNTPDGEVLGWIQIGHNQKQHTLSITASESLLAVMPQVLSRVRHLFDLHCDPQNVYEGLRQMNSIKPGLCVLGIRVPGCYNAFEMAVRAILGQQITVKAASTLAGRLVQELGTPLTTCHDGLTHVFPTATELLCLPELTDILGSLGVIGARARTIAGLAQALDAGVIGLDVSVNPEEEIEALKSIKGIGNWTAQYLAMRTMEWPDAFLETDVGVKHALAPRTPKEALLLAEQWRPWRSYAMVNLWNSLT